LAKVKFRNNKFDEANALLDNAEKKCEVSNYETGILAVQLIRATYNKPSEAMELQAIKAFQKSKEVGLINEQLEALAILEKIKSSQGNAAAAYEYSKEYDNLKSKIDATVSQNRIYTYEISAQIEKNLNELKNLRDTNELAKRDKTIQRNVIIAIIIAALFIVTYVYRRYKEKAKFVEEYFSSDTGVVLKSGKKLLFENIMRVETDRNDVVLITNEGKIVEKSTTLKEFEANLPKIQFGKCQRGIILNFQSVDHVQKTKLSYKGESINITPKYRDEFLAQWENFYLNMKSSNKN
jgi:DNA-binding LytR/AlgR family response regulator